MGATQHTVSGPKCSEVGAQDAKGQPGMVSLGRVRRVFHLGEPPLAFSEPKQGQESLHTERTARHGMSEPEGFLNRLPGAVDNVIIAD